MPRPDTLAHLSALYAAQPDPWSHFTSAYEQEKYDATLAALEGRRFRSGVEIGCGNGALAGRLADLCDALVAVECIPAAADHARRHLAAQRHVQVVEVDVLQGLPAADPDLVVLSEVLYFLEPEEIDTLAERLRAGASAGACILAVNWLGETGQTLSGRQAADRLSDGLATWHRHRSERERYLIDLFRAPDGGAAAPAERPL